MNVAVNFAGNKLQVFFQVVGQRSHQYVFIGLSHASRVDSLHIVVVDEASQNRLYARTPAFGEKPGVVLVHPRNSRTSRLLLQ